MTGCSPEKRLAIVIVLSVILGLNICIAYGWDNETTHREMTWMAGEFLMRKADSQELNQEVARNLDWMVQGARDEDVPLHRAWNHFLPALNGDVLGVVHDSSTCDSEQWGFEDSDCTVSSTDQFARSERSLCWPFVKCTIPESNTFRWKDATDNSCTAKGWADLGHILHLLEDMAVPDHTRSHAHPFGSIEQYTKELLLPYPDDSEELMSFEKPEDSLKKLAKYTRENYFSDDTCFDPNLPGPGSVREDGQYFYTTNNRRIAYKGARYWLSWVPGFPDAVYNRRAATLDDTIYDEEYHDLGPKAILYAASLIKHYWDHYLVPGTPSDPVPSDRAQDISTSPILTWTATANTDSYDVYFGTDSNPPYLGNTMSASYPLSGLSPNTVYYWEVVAKNNCDNSTSGSVWSFTTMACTYFISATNQSFGPGGGTGSVSVAAPGGCNWTATSNASWITINSGSIGNGDGTVLYVVDFNPSTDGRTGTMTIAGQTFTVTQDGTPLSLNVTSASCTKIPFDPMYGYLRVDISGTASGPVGATVYSGNFPLGSGECSSWTDGGACSRGANEASSTSWTISRGGWTGTLMWYFSVEDSLGGTVEATATVTCPNPY